jgi:hypothetical protein
MSVCVAVLMTVASLAGIVDANRVYVGLDRGLLTLFIGQDVLNLLVGVPILLASMWLARRGSVTGLLMWPGALFYVLYDYGYYVLGGPFNGFFLAYIALMTLSAYSMIAVVVSLDAVAVRSQLATAIRPRAIGGFLVGLAILFTALWSALVASALIGGTEFGLVPRVVTTLDLTLQLPALFVGGVLLIRRHPLGYVVAPGLLLQASAYLPGLSTISLLQGVVLEQSFDATAVVPGFIVGVIGLLMIGSVVRAAGRPSERTVKPVAIPAHLVT